jgi:hypothetical protein
VYQAGHEERAGGVETVLIAAEQRLTFAALADLVRNSI